MVQIGEVQDAHAVWAVLNNISIDDFDKLAGIHKSLMSQIKQAFEFYKSADENDPRRDKIIVQLFNEIDQFKVRVKDYKQMTDDLQLNVGIKDSDLQNRCKRLRLMVKTMDNFVIGIVKKYQ